MVPPCITAIIYQESCGWSFVITGLLCVLLGFILTHKKPKKQSLLYERRICHRSLKLDHTEYHGVPSLPHQRLDHQSHRRSIRDSVRFYHTGASIIKDVEALPSCVLFWRSLTHWIGGMGVLVFLLSILHITGSGSHMNLMKAESPGPSVNKLTPTVRSTAKTLYLIYLGMTIIEIIFLLVGGMPLFDTLTITFGSAGTGGFGSKTTVWPAIPYTCR